MRSFHLGAAAFVVAAALAGGAFAEETKFTATLSGGAEAPPVETAGAGTVAATWNSDTKELTWTVEFSGLSGPPAAMHFHGPAAAGENAGVVVPIEDLESPAEGSATLTDEQAGQLADGMWYVNIHTAAHPDGEIRGQVTAGM